MMGKKSRLRRLGTSQEERSTSPKKYKHVDQKRIEKEDRRAQRAQRFFPFRGRKPVFLLNLRKKDEV